MSPSVINIQPVHGPRHADDYPISRGLYVNSVKGFANVTAGRPSWTLLNFFRTPASIDPIVTGRNFIQVPASVTRLERLPAPVTDAST